MISVLPVFVPLCLWFSVCTVGSHVHIGPFDFVTPFFFVRGKWKVKSSVNQNEIPTVSASASHPRAGVVETGPRY